MSSVIVCSRKLGISWFLSRPHVRFPFNWVWTIRRYDSDIVAFDVDSEKSVKARTGGAAPEKITGQILVMWIRLDDLVSLGCLKNLVSRPPDQSIVDASGLPVSYSNPPRVKEAVKIARQNLEEILLYAIAQLAMWVSKPDFEGGVGVVKMDAEEDGYGHASAPGHGKGSSMAMDVSSRFDTMKDKRAVAGASVGVAPRPSGTVTLAERLRRKGLTAEIAGDLQALLTKSKPIITASDRIIGKPVVDLTQILLTFLHEHVGSS